MVGLGGGWDYGACFLLQGQGSLDAEHKEVASSLQERSKRTGKLQIGQADKDLSAQPLAWSHRLVAVAC